MAHRILITGVSGYLGGTLLARLSTLNPPLPTHEKLYVLVRSLAQADGVAAQARGSSLVVEPLIFDPYDAAAVRRVVTQQRITVVFFLIDALRGDSQAYFIRALGEVRASTGEAVHFLHTTGAKIFSSHAGAPTDRPLLDTEPGLYEIQKEQAKSGPLPVMREATGTNNRVIDLAEENGVRSYIFAPCIVYGKGEGFGRKISIQTVDIVRAAKAVRQVHKVDEGKPTWPVCNIIDNTTLYIQLLQRILTADKDGLPGHGKNGYYLASSGSVAWDDLYSAMAAALAKRGVVDDATVTPADKSALERMGAALGYGGPEMVPLAIGGKCTFTAAHGKTLGWKPLYEPEHILEVADEEVEHILQNLVP